MRFDLGDYYLVLDVVLKKPRRFKHGATTYLDKFSLMEAMAKLGVSDRKALAAHIGVSPVTLSRHLRGARRNPDALEKIDAFVNEAGRAA